MTFKLFLKPDKYKVIVFIVLFSILFFIPYLKSTPAPDAGDLIVPGHYPLIFIFLASLVVLMEVFTGTLTLSDSVFFASFLIGFFVLYLFSCLLGILIAKLKKTSLPGVDNDALEYGKDKYVLDLEDSPKSEQ